MKKLLRGSKAFANHHLETRLPESAQRPLREQTQPGKLAPELKIPQANDVL